MNGVTAIVGSLFTYGLGSIETNALFKYQVNLYEERVVIPRKIRPDLTYV